MAKMEPRPSGASQGARRATGEAPEGRAADRGRFSARRKTDASHGNPWRLSYDTADRAKLALARERPEPAGLTIKNPRTIFNRHFPDRDWRPGRLHPGSCRGWACSIPSLGRARGARGLPASSAVA